MKSKILIGTLLSLSLMSTALAYEMHMGDYQSGRGFQCNRAKPAQREDATTDENGKPESSHKQIADREPVGSAV